MLLHKNMQKTILSEGYLEIQKFGIQIGTNVN